MEDAVASNLVGKPEQKFALVLQGGLHFFMRRSIRILFIEISKQAISSLTKT